MFRDFILGEMRKRGKTVEDLCSLCGKSRSTVYRILSDPDSMDRQTIRLLHRHFGIDYAELMERR